MIIFTKHALERMKQRAITRDEIVQVLSQPKERLADELGHSIAQSETNGMILRVFFVERDDNFVVITVYKTTKEKYRSG